MKGYPKEKQRGRWSTLRPATALFSVSLVFTPWPGCAFPGPSGLNGPRAWVAITSIGAQCSLRGRGIFLPPPLLRGREPPRMPSRKDEGPGRVELPTTAGIPQPAEPQPPLVSFSLTGAHPRSAVWPVPPAEEDRGPARPHDIAEPHPLSALRGSYAPPLPSCYSVYSFSQASSARRSTSSATR